MLLILALLFLSPLLLPLTAHAEKVPAFLPNDGETVVFLGDSITHQCLYTQYLEDFFITRYPERTIHFHNAGKSGDNASKVLARFERDVAALQPDYVTLLLGMNDGGYQDYHPETFATYQTDLRVILDRINALGAKAILLSPTMFDHHNATLRKDDETWRFHGKPISENYNALMAYFGGFALEEARLRRLAYVNLWEPLNSHTIALRRSQPDTTLIFDSIHPQASGQFIMAFEIINQLGTERKSTASIIIQRKGQRWTSRQATNLNSKDHGSEITFNHTATSLPWVIPKTEATIPLKWLLPSDGRLGYKITKAGHKLSADRLKVSGLAPGNYQVTIDDVPIGTWSHTALASKIEIQENPLTPQYQQALKVALLNQKRNDELVRPMRTLWGKYHGILQRTSETGAPPSSNTEEIANQALDLQQQAQQQLLAIYEAAQPKPHTWAIRKIQPTPKP